LLATYQTVRRWLALARSELRPIGETNAIVAMLAEFARVQIRAARRRIVTDQTPVGDREAIVSYVVLVHTGKVPLSLAPEETLAFPAVMLVVAVFVCVVQPIIEILRASTCRLLPIEAVLRQAD
jgi:hypothetical protein